jgi:hypothetical protein
MYMVSFRYLGTAIWHAACDESSLFALSKVLQEHEHVQEFQVTTGDHIWEADDFGWIGFGKWVKRLSTDGDHKVG